MKTLARLMFVSMFAILMLGAMTASADDEGFRTIFDGKTLDGWDGDPKFWSVEDGAMTGETTADNPTQGNTFIVWRGGTPGDFELKVEYRLRNHNSGIQFRSFENPDEWGRWVIGGYQADLAENKQFDGLLYGERYRGILCMRGDKTVIGEDHKAKVVGKVGDATELLSHIKQDDWNEYHIVAKGNRLTHSINGHQMVECTDDDVEMCRADGLLAFQLHAGPPMKVQFRNIRLKEETAKKKIVLVAGPKSHGYGSHEHNAGCLLLAKCLNENMPNVEAVVYQSGWPKEPGALDGAAAIVVFSDGGGGHPMRPHMDEVAPLMAKGVGLACLHYAVEIPKGPDGDRLKDWTGGYFETDWSVNPHWRGNFKALPDHPITRGVKPFFMDDEWYYHMRFVDNMEGVTPILTDVPPDSTRERPDSAHGGNPHVRARKGEPEHVAWARVRSDGGRGFGFTGCHWHWSWASDNFRTVVLNAIVWTAGLEVPEGGVPSKRPTIAELQSNQDYPQPDNFDPEPIKELIRQWNQ